MRSANTGLKLVINNGPKTPKKTVTEVANDTLDRTVNKLVKYGWVVLALALYAVIFWKALWL